MSLVVLVASLIPMLLAEGHPTQVEMNRISAIGNYTLLGAHVFGLLLFLTCSQIFLNFGSLTLARYCVLTPSTPEGLRRGGGGNFGWF
jgi:hypothetical protein